ncbi:MAG: hypothetical protein KKB02_11610 [Alphaproteobacteria bacterium]|nr:hypothetical protein [Alphaproteobacteria bacterium]
MIPQGVSVDQAGFSAPEGVSDPQLNLTTTPEVARPGGEALQRRLTEVLREGVPRPFLLAAEQVGSTLIVLPRSSARQRAAMLTFAAEDRIAASVDRTRVAPGPVVASAGAPQLAFIVDRGVLDACPVAADRILPEYLLIARPAEGWAVWRDADRCVVRAADGTGFAASAAMLPLLWTRAGQPAVASLGDPLPTGVASVPAIPAPPDPVELAYGLPRVRPGDAARTWRPVMVVAGVLALGLMAHLAVLAADVAALSRIADRAKVTAQAAMAGPLPGIAVTSDVGPILARLGPTVAAPQGSALLPLLSDVSLALSDAGAAASFRRLAWGAAENELVVLVQAADLDGLQAVERGLTERGFAVRPGAASAGDGGAEAEMRISRASS